MLTSTQSRSLTAGYPTVALALHHTARCFLSDQHSAFSFCDLWPSARAADCREPGLVRRDDLRDFPLR